MSSSPDPSSGAPAQSASETEPSNGGEDVPDEVKSILGADPFTGWWTLLAFVILAVGTALSYLVWRLVKPADFMPASGYAVYAGLFVMALAIERVLEPFSGLFVPSTKNKKMMSNIATAQAKHAQAIAITGPRDTAPAIQARREAVVAQNDFHRSQGIRAVLMWATAAVLAMVACAALGIFLLRSVETPGAAKGSAASASVNFSGSTPPAPGPARDPDRLLDLLVTGLVVGAGTKPLHDLISQIQTSSGNSKAGSSATAAG
jgi:hypothetical protein